MRDFELSREGRQKYLRAILNILHEKYFVDISRLSMGIGIARSYLYDFMQGYGNRNPTHKTMDKIEMYVNDLYEPIVRDEIDFNRLYFDKMANDDKRKNGQKETP